MYESELEKRGSPVDISTLKSGDHVTDGEQYYKVYASPYQENGVWLVSTTNAGDFEYVFSQGDFIWKEEPEWLVEIRERKRLKALEAQTELNSCIKPEE